jgi:hypothetical protein
MILPPHSYDDYIPGIGLSLLLSFGGFVLKRTEFRSQESVRNQELGIRNQELENKL